jgi:probable rRNA maturation factor
MSLDLAVDDGIALPSGLRRQLRTEVARMVRAAARRDRVADYDASLRLVDDAAIHALNRDYRRKDKPTDVLAFAQREQLPPGAAAALHAGVLGDIVISIDTARRQARRGLYRELLHLASHGLCHLLGYDHRDDAEERAMNARAKALRAEAARRGRVRPA